MEQSIKINRDDLVDILRRYFVSIPVGASLGLSRSKTGGEALIVKWQVEPVPMGE